MRCCLPVLVACLGLAFASATAVAQSSTPRADPTCAARAIDPAGVPGARILAGGGRLPAAIYERFFALAGGDEAVVVLVPTASSRADSESSQARLVAQWRESRPDAEFVVLHTRDRERANDEEFCAPLRRATAVWFGGGQQRRLAEAYVGTRFEREVMALLDRGGVVGGSSAGLAIQTRTMIQSGNPEPVLGQGLDLVPGAIGDQHFRARERLPRLRRALAQTRGAFGFGVDEGTALVVQGRAMRVLGASDVTLVLPAGAGHEEKIVRLSAGERADLVSWQRAAAARVGAAWPPATMAAPRVPSGAVMLAGGGRLPAAVIDRFVALAGGADGKIVLVPSASPAPRGGRGGSRDRRLYLRGAFEKRGAEVAVLDCAHPDEVTPERLTVLADATGVWFGGGRQWRLVDAFADTLAMPAFRAVLERGGVIGGSSAGATIQGDFLVRGNPLGNRDMACEGYDRGFAFLPGCAVDQHFLARNRMRDLAGLIETHPQLIGIGVDEGTAAVVAGHELEVIGASKIAIYDWRRLCGRFLEASAADNGGAPEPVWLSPGDRWDLVAGERR